MNRTGEKVSGRRGPESILLMKLFTSIALSCALAACGDGFSNAPFHTGSVEGRFTGASAGGG
ncbi:MAG: hypothetical protein ACK4N5_17690, partial [Myxococcales bacterium]